MHVGDDPQGPEELLGTPHLSDALESNRFKRFLDHLPFAVVVSDLHPEESISYANAEFERLTGKPAAEVKGQGWGVLPHAPSVSNDDLTLSDAIIGRSDYIGTFLISRDDTEITVDAWSNIIESDSGWPLFRLVALAEIGVARTDEAEDVEARIRDKDTLLREIQHRVKNNLQMITALIRLEARNVADDAAGDRFDRLAGRVGSLALLYDTLSADACADSVDLGVYLSRIASAVMQAHAQEGIRLDLSVDTWPVSINVAMPTGLVVNELLTNSLKHAFGGREGGTITLHSLVDDQGCRVIIADDGMGLEDGVQWPKPGKLSALIVESLRTNAQARVDVESARGHGMRVTIFFARDNAAPESN